MIKIFCDRCGREISNKDRIFLHFDPIDVFTDDSLSGELSGESQIVELCPGCTVLIYKESTNGKNNLLHGR